MDNELQTFVISGEGHEFNCVPSQTSNFDIFRLSNPKLSDNKAQEIWEYYRELFISAKLLGDNLTSFRKTLQRFIENKPYKGDEIPFGESNNRSRYEDINSYIGLARWLELQYTVDTIIAQLSEDWTEQKLTQEANRVLGTVPFNNYVSYFSSNIHNKLKDPADYDNRKLLVRSVYAYTHKQIRWYVCASEYGAVKLWIHTKHNSFLPMFEERVKNGVTINVVTSKILLNIDNTTPYIKIENFFLDP